MRISKLIRPLPGLYLVDALVERLAVEQGQDDPYGAMILAKARKAIHEGKLKAFDPETGDLLNSHEEKSPLTTVECFNEWRKSCGGKLLKEPAPLELAAIPALKKTLSCPNDEWKIEARQQAKAIIARQGKKDLHPNLEDIADEIAKDWRERRKYGTKGTPLSGGYIKRHALQGQGIAINRKSIILTPKGRGK